MYVVDRFSSQQTLSLEDSTSSKLGVSTNPHSSAFGLPYEEERGVEEGRLQVPEKRRKE